MEKREKAFVSAARGLIEYNQHNNATDTRRANIGDLAVRKTTTSESIDPLALD
jgi:hypothetical protein